MVTLDTDRGSHTRGEKARSVTVLLHQAREKERRTNCQASYSPEAPGVDLPYPQRWYNLSENGKDSRIL